MCDPKIIQWRFIDDPPTENGMYNAIISDGKEADFAYCEYRKEQGWRVMVGGWRVILWHEIPSLTQNLIREASKHESLRSN